MRFRIAAVLAFATALAACNGDTGGEQVDDGDRRAKGDVVGGTISDDMLPLDRLRSQSPPLEPSRAAPAGEAAPAQAPAEDPASAEEQQAEPQDEAEAEG